jgi:hypothetical protein
MKLGKFALLFIATVAAKFYTELKAPVEKTESKKTGPLDL